MARHPLEICISSGPLCNYEIKVVYAYQKLPCKANPRFCISGVQTRIGSSLELRRVYFRQGLEQLLWEQMLELLR